MPRLCPASAAGAAKAAGAVAPAPPPPPATVFVVRFELVVMDAVDSKVIGAYTTYAAAKRAMRAEVKFQMQGFLEGFLEASGAHPGALDDYFACKPGAETASGLDRFETEGDGPAVKGVRPRLTAEFEMDTEVCKLTRVFKVDEVEVRR